MAEHRPPLVVIVGPTAVGKTAVAIHVAESLGGEIISADSRQVYRGMDIGTAKPAAEERCRVPHHLVDILEPDQELTLAEYQARAYAAIENVHQRGLLPLLVGGTGQYVRAVVQGWSIPRVPSQPALRADLETFADVYGPAALHAWLATVDTEAARTIDARNVRRVVRALEVYLETGSPISLLQQRQPPPYRLLQIGLMRPRAALYARIDARIEQMLADGLLDEVRRLLGAGYDWSLSSMRSLGYIQFSSYFAGQTTLDEAVQALRRETCRFVRQQATWFRLDDPAIRWFDLEQVSENAVVEYVRQWVAQAAA